MSYRDEYEIIASIPGKRSKSFRARHKKTGRDVLIHLMDQMHELALPALPADKKVLIFETHPITGGLVLITDTSVKLPIEDWLIDPEAASETDQLLKRGKWHISQFGLASQPEIQVAGEGHGTAPQASASLSSIPSAMSPETGGVSVPLEFSPETNAEPSENQSPSLIVARSEPVAAPPSEFTSKFILSGAIPRTGPANLQDKPNPPAHLPSADGLAKIQPPVPANSEFGVPAISRRLDSAPSGDFTRIFHSSPAEKPRGELTKANNPPEGNFTEMLEGNRGEFSYALGQEATPKLDTGPDPTQPEGDFTRLLKVPLPDQADRGQRYAPSAPSLGEIPAPSSRSQPIQFSQTTAPQLPTQIDTISPKPANYLPLVFILAGLVVVAIAMLIYFVMR